MKRQPQIPIIKSPTKRKILLLLYTGIILGISRSPNKRFHLLKNLYKEWHKIDRDYLWRVIREFNDDKLVDWQENKDGTILVVLTDKGKLTVNRFNPDILAIPTPSEWDNKWRVVIYDIPDTKKSARDALRYKLKELGFKEWQKSVFIYPYPCREQIDFVIEFFDLRPYVRQAELINPTNESSLKLNFKL